MAVFLAVNELLHSQLHTFQGHTMVRRNDPNYHYFLPARRFLVDAFLHAPTDFHHQRLAYIYTAHMTRDLHIHLHDTERDFFLQSVIIPDKIKHTLNSSSPTTWALLNRHRFIFPLIFAVSAHLKTCAGSLLFKYTCAGLYGHVTK